MTVYIIAYLGLMCFDGINREYFDTRCNIPFQEAVTISDKSCSAYLTFKDIPKIKLNNYRKIIKCQQEGE